MANPDIDDLVVSALNALASSPGGMTMADFASHLESRHGPTDEAADDAGSPQSRQFQATVLALISGAGGLVDRNYASLDASGGMIQITPEGRAFIGR